MSDKRERKTDDNRTHHHWIEEGCAGVLAIFVLRDTLVATHVSPTQVTDHQVTGVRDADPSARDDGSSFG